MDRVACIIIVGGKRRELVDARVLPSVLQQNFAEVLVVGDHHAGEGYSYLHVPGITNSTVDALIKRDVGTVASTSDRLVYLSDDHALHWDFLQQLHQCVLTWDVIVPSRWAEHPTLGRIRIPMGDTEGYMAGHGGVFKRWVIRERPWTTMPHDRIWDVLASKVQWDLGTRWMVVPQMQIEDLEVDAKPWQ